MLNTLREDEMTENTAAKKARKTPKDDDVDKAVKDVLEKMDMTTNTVKDLMNKMR